MPEGPEVRREAEMLSKKFNNNRLIDIEIISGRYVHKSMTGFEELQKLLPLRFVGGGCHGKFLYFILEDGSHIQNTLGMTGWWSDSANKHARICFHTENFDLFYIDQRNFGTLSWHQNRTRLFQKLHSLGPDIMQSGNIDKFISRIRKKNHWNICKAIMDQQIIAGIGNYLKAEILYDCQINPECTVADLSNNKLQELFESASRIAWMSYNLGGATIRNYRSGDGTEGIGQQRFAVYGQIYDPYGNKVERLITPDGRTTHWVPIRQMHGSIQIKEMNIMDL